METSTGEKVSFLKVSSQFSEKQYAAPLPSGFTSPYLSFPQSIRPGRSANKTTHNSCL